ncbi:MAG: peptidoglycan-binding protein [Alphaproteobacteria bacterium]|nr:MAG: peptidoglycan-binding protein [Alphaproteobacteria bacterium]PZO37270.1 MAG: peptidoglycan-binding protein [Alphaproteobacteria bacterium]
MIDALNNIHRARRLLDDPVAPPASAAPALGAALLAALAAVTMAGVVIIGPTVEISEPAIPLFPSA